MEEGDINQYIIDEINSDRPEILTDFIDHKSFIVFKGIKQGEGWLTDEQENSTYIVRLKIEYDKRTNRKTL